ANAITSQTEFAGSPAATETAVLAVSDTAPFRCAIGSSAEIAKVKATHWSLTFSGSDPGLMLPATLALSAVDVLALSELPAGEIEVFKLPKSAGNPVARDVPSEWTVTSQR